MEEGEYKESLQKKATAAGFDRPIDYLWHEREKDPQYCRISYEVYKKIYVACNKLPGLGNFVRERKVVMVGEMVTHKGGCDGGDALE
ncbi:hypothetical protein CsSME_00000138 [Camellia sinensis var. sinensis]